MLQLRSARDCKSEEHALRCCGQKPKLQSPVNQTTALRRELITQLKNCYPTPFHLFPSCARMHSFKGRLGLTPNPGHRMNCERETITKLDCRYCGVMIMHCYSYNKDLFIISRLVGATKISVARL